MIRLDKNALLCDFAETYHVYDVRRLPARYAATLAAGLRPGSRIMLKAAGAPADAETLLLAAVADGVRVLAWQNTKDARKGRNAPKSLLSAIYGERKKKIETGPGFDSPEAFRAWNARMTKKGG